MKKMFLAAAAMAMSLPGVAQAAATVTVNFSGTTAIPANNDFQSQLNGLGFTSYASLGASLIANGPVSLTFEFLGSESGYNDTFSTGSGVTYTESSWFENHFAAPILIGTTYFAGGDLKNFLNFTTSGAGGANATVGDDGFGIFLTRGATSGYSTNVFYLGYDDQITRKDDNHDDFIVRVTVNSPVPEPSTWAMLLFGFGVVGFALRRRVSRTASFA